jgi:hypothetical protein
MEWPYFVGQRIYKENIGRTNSKTRCKGKQKSHDDSENLVMTNEEQNKLLVMERGCHLRMMKNF